jgi:hypothetical protein
MRSILILAVAALSVASCTYRSETVARETPSGRAVVSESASIGTPTLVIRE